MNPQLARWHVQDAMAESYMSTSPYAYCGNDPINRVDVLGLTWWDNLTGWLGETTTELGNIIKDASDKHADYHRSHNFGETAIGFLAPFAGESLLAGAIRGEFDFTMRGSTFNNNSRIFIGMFAADTNEAGWGKQYVSRLNWEGVQTSIGYHYGAMRNISGNCDRVEYFDGITVLVGAGQEGSVTLGNYILFAPGHGDPSWTNQTFIHEFGHTRQSRGLGVFYLGLIGSNSLVSSLTNDKFGESWVEIYANNLGLDYAQQNHGFTGDWNLRNRFPLSYETRSFWPWWLRLINQ